MNPITNESDTKSNWVTIGKDYVVIEILVTPQKIVLFRYLSDDDDYPTLAESILFDSICTKMPSNWEVRLDETGGIHIAPRAWLRSGFWEDYFNGEIEAIKQYEKELAGILSEIE